MTVETATERWRPTEIVRAYRNAWRVLRLAGFTTAPLHHLFFDHRDGWWALPEGLDDHYSFVSGEIWTTYVRETGVGALPPGLIAFLGGVDSPCAWALEVVRPLSRLSRCRRAERSYARELAAIAALPEWASLQRAAEAAGGPTLVALGNLERAMSQRRLGLNLDDAIEAGFRAGEALGFQTAASMVASNEMDRTSSARRETKPLDDFLRSNSEGYELPWESASEAARCIDELRNSQQLPAALAGVGLPALDRLRKNVAESAARLSLRFRGPQ